MATSGAALMEEKRSRATMDARKILRALAPEELSSYTYTQAAAAVILGVDPGTLADAREKREEMLKNKNVIAPLQLESIHFVVTMPRASYPALELLNYLDRVAHAGLMSSDAQKYAIKYPEKIRPTVLLCFQTWLIEATPVDVWPFCIGSGGRPMDLMAALILNQTTEEVEWLTIREFGQKAADAASLAFAEMERVSINVPIPEKPDDGLQGGKQKRTGGPL